MHSNGKSSVRDLLSQVAGLHKWPLCWDIKDEWMLSDGSKAMGNVRWMGKRVQNTNQ